MNTAYDSVIAQIVESIYATMLNMELVRVEEPASLDHESLLATVQISGEWTGCVLVGLSPSVACASAAAMLHIAEDDVTAADRVDVAAELANMVGGNLKSILPSPSFLSLPTVVAGRDFNLRIHDAEKIEDVSMACAAGAIRVRLYTEIRKGSH